MRDEHLRWLVAPPAGLRDRIPGRLHPVPGGPDEAAVPAIRVLEDCTELEELPPAIAQRRGYREIPELTRTPAGTLLRPEVIARLEQAQAALPDGLRLLVLDGWRSPRFQQQLLSYYDERTDGDLTGFVSDPHDPKIIAPHTTGGAVDLTLIAGDVPLALGTDWDAFSPVSAVDHFEREGSVKSHADALARDLRRVLARAMLGAGFAPLATEWWHWSFGDQRWAAFHGLEATLYAPTDEDGRPRGAF